MPTPPNPNDPAYKRLILFPLAVFYMATLVLAGWPRQLAPTSRVVDAVQMTANHTLAQIAVIPAINIFTGETAGDRTATLGTCFRLEGARQGEEPSVTLFDSMALCEPGGRSESGIYTQFHNQHLRRGIDHLHTPGAALDRNRLPLNALFSILDYHCHAHAPEKFFRVYVTSRRQRLNLDTGRITDRVIFDGMHNCEVGRWGIRQRLISENVFDAR